MVDIQLVTSLPPTSSPPSSSGGVGGGGEIGTSLKDRLATFQKVVTKDTLIIIVMMRVLLGKFFYIVCRCDVVHLQYIYLTPCISHAPTLTPLYQLGSIPTNLYHIYQ